MNKAFSDAIAKAQSEINHAKLDSKNPHFKSEYASLEAHIDNIKPALAKHGLSLIQSVESREGNLWLKSQLIFGEEILETGIPLILQKNDMQGLGSAITYARRYCVAALFNMGSDDDDGNEAVKKPENPGGFVKTSHSSHPQSSLPKKKTLEGSVNETQTGQQAVLTSAPAPLNHAPQTRLEAYKIPFDFGTVKSGTKLSDLGKEGVEKLRSAVISYQNKAEKDGKDVSPRIVEFIELANEFLK